MAAVNCIPLMWSHVVAVEGGQFPAHVVLDLGRYLTVGRSRLLRRQRPNKKGAVKHPVNLRPKRTGARWRMAHVGLLFDPRDSPEWTDLWPATHYSLQVPLAPPPPM